MNFIRKFVNIKRRCIHTTSFLKSSLISENLSNERSLIRVQGNDEIVPFLQGLITNDMIHFDRGAKSIYAMFLNKSGRVLHDTIIYKTFQPNTFIIETDKKGSNELCKHLRLFRVRRKINIDVVDSDYQLWILFQNYNDSQNDKHKSLTIDDLNIPKNLNSKEILICTDPRVKDLGTRLILPKSINNENLTEIIPNVKLIESKSDNDYRILRYKLGVSEGMAEHQYNKILPFETNIDYLHGVSFHKGCYLGQELTARTYHTGVIRKRIMPIKLSKPIEGSDEAQEIHTSNGTACGIIRGTKNHYCIATVRIEKAMQAQSLLINNEPCTLIIPEWWPKELPNKLKLKDKQL